MFLELLGDLERAQNRRLRRGPKHQCSAVTGGQTHQLAFRFGEPELLGSAHDPPQRFDLFALLSDQRLRVSDDVDEQHMSDFELYVWGMLGRHVIHFAFVFAELLEARIAAERVPIGSRRRSARVTGTPSEILEQVLQSADRSVLLARNEPRCGRGRLHIQGRRRRLWRLAMRQWPASRARSH